MGKLMVAEGLGATVLPDFSVDGDPLERGGTIVCRPPAGDATADGPGRCRRPRGTGTRRSCAGRPNRAGRWHGSLTSAHTGACRHGSSASPPLFRYGGSRSADGAPVRFPER